MHISVHMYKRIQAHCTQNTNHRSRYIWMPKNTIKRGNSFFVCRADLKIQQQSHSDSKSCVCVHCGVRMKIRIFKLGPNCFLLQKCRQRNKQIRKMLLALRVNYIKSWKLRTTVIRRMTLRKKAYVTPDITARSIESIRAPSTTYDTHNPKVYAKITKKSSTSRKK